MVSVARQVPREEAPLVRRTLALIVAVTLATVGPASAEPTAYGGLALAAFERLAATSGCQGLVEDFTLLRRKAPEFLRDPLLRSVCGVALTPITPGMDTVLRQDVLRARQVLTNAGSDRPLRDDQLGEAFHRLIVASGLGRAYDMDLLEAGPFLLALRRVAHAQACIAQLGSQSADRSCPEGQPYRFEPRGDGGWELVCPEHGTARAPRLPPFPYDEARIKAIVERNSVVWAAREAARLAIAPPR